MDLNKKKALVDRKIIQLINLLHILDQYSSKLRQFYKIKT